jgi:hypothetical protein
VWVEEFVNVGTVYRKQHLVEIVYKDSVDIDAVMFIAGCVMNSELQLASSTVVYLNYNFNNFDKKQNLKSLPNERFNLPLVPRSTVFTLIERTSVNEQWIILTSRIINFSIFFFFF